MRNTDKKGYINCFQCKHFFVTWDKKYTKGCKAMGFKSQEVPSLVVYESSGIQCLRYEEKDKTPRR